jgi:hypothetical protein
MYDETHDNEIIEELYKVVSKLGEDEKLEKQ